MLFQKWRYGFDIFVQKPDVLAIEKHCNDDLLQLLSSQDVN